MNVHKNAKLTPRGRESMVRRVVELELAARGILILSPSMRGIAEEAPGAYKDVSGVVKAADEAGLARIVARVEPLITVKG